MLRILATLLLLTGSAYAKCEVDRVDVRGAFGTVAFDVEVADDPQERSKGLMFRKELGDTSGMIFLYDRPSRLSFWMRNTLIELDLIFVDEQGVIGHIHHRAQPHDETPIVGGVGVAVLEIPGGRAKSIGISVGDALRHPFFETSSAAWPC